MTLTIARVIALLALTLPVTAIALPFSNIYVLGDSLSDQGNLFAATTAAAGPASALPAADHYFNGRFSNGPVYTDIVAAQLGLTLRPSILGGTNFAYGGARTTYNTVESTVGGPFPPGLFPWSLNAEVVAFNARNIRDPAGLYLVFSGANDVADILARGLNPNLVIPGAVGGIVRAVQAFANAGARTVVVPNIPDLGLTPLFLSRGATVSGAATALSMQFNSLLDAQLALISGLNIIEIDTFSIIRNMAADPGKFGLTNVTQPCYSGFVAPNPAGTECSNPNEFLFWDSVHPTSAVQAVLATRVLAAIPEPATWLLFLLGLPMLTVRTKSASPHYARPRAELE